MTIKITGIKWEADDMKDVENISTDLILNIPQKVEIKNKEDLENYIENELSNQIGFTHNGWENYELISNK